MSGQGELEQKGQGEVGEGEGGDAKNITSFQYLSPITPLPLHDTCRPPYALHILIPIPLVFPSAFDYIKLAVRKS